MSLPADQSRTNTTRKKRLACVISGCILVLINLVLINLWAIQHGKLGGIDERYRQPVFVSAIGAVGVVFIAAGLAPEWLIVKMTALKKYRPYLFRKPGSVAEKGLTKTAKPK